MDETIRQELTQLRTQNQQLEQALIQVQQAQQAQQDLAAALANLPQAVAGIPQAVQAAIAAMPVGGGSRRSMIDIKGLGKPSPLQNPEADFVTWARRTENFVASVFPGARDVLAWAVELDPSTAANWRPLQREKKTTR